MVPAAVGGISLLVVVFWVVGIVDLMRHRHTMPSGQFVLWAVVIILLPFIGLIVYFMWRLGRSDAMADALSVPRDEKGTDEQPTAGRM
jgi:hypothetical protein